MNNTESDETAELMLDALELMGKSDETAELMLDALELMEDVYNGITSGNDVADKLDSYAKTILESHGSCMLVRRCDAMAKKARGE